MTAERNFNLTAGARPHRPTMCLYMCVCKYVRMLTVRVSPLAIEVSTLRIRIGRA